MKGLRTILIAFAVVSTVGCKKEEKAAEAPKAPPDAAKAAAPADAAAAAAPKVVTVEGMQTPESVLYDDQTDLYLVSNINGNPADKDDNGFIARVAPAPDAKVAEAAWIDGKNEKVTLHAPKGMALVGDLLYVADVDTVRMFDRKTGEPKGEVAIKGATFLNDVVAGDGVVYVTDTALDKEFKAGKTQAIYEIKDKKAKKLIGGEELGGPNGVAFVDGELWVVTFASGELYKVKDGKRDAVEKLPKGQLDGIAVTGDGRLLVSSWEGKTIFVGKPGAWSEAATNVESPADIGFDTKRSAILVPVFTGNRVEIRELPAAAAGGDAAGGTVPAEGDQVPAPNQ